MRPAHGMAEERPPGDKQKAPSWRQRSAVLQEGAFCERTRLFQKFYPVKQTFADQAQRNGRQGVQHRMLLGQEGGRDDQNHQAGEQEPPPQSSFLPVQKHRQNGNGVGRVEGGQNPGRGIEAVDEGQNPGEEIVPGHGIRPQKLDAWPDDVNKHCPGLRNHDVDRQPPEIWNVVEEEIEQRACHQTEPEQIGNYKDLAEGDHVVQSAVDHVAAFKGDQVFRDKIEGEIDDPAAQQQHVPIFGACDVG